MTSLRLWKSRCPQGTALNAELCLAVRALDIGLVRESFDTQNVTKVDAVLYLAIGARSVDNKLFWKEELLRYELGDEVDWISADYREEERVKSNGGKGEDFKDWTEPNGEENSKGRNVKEVRSELVFLQSDGTNTGINETLWLRRNSKLGTGIPELILERVELRIRKKWLALLESLHGSKVPSFLSVERNNFRTAPLQIFFQKIPLIIREHLTSGSIV